MAIHLRSHAFAANPLRGLSASSAVSPSAAAEALRSLLDPGAGVDAASPHPHLSKVLPFRRGRPLALSPDAPPLPADAAPAWRLAWLPPSRVPAVPPDAFVFLGAHGVGNGKEAAAYWAVDVGEASKVGGAGDASAFVDLRTLMVATDWNDKDAMGELAIAGHVRAVLQLLAILSHLQVVQT
jgi:NAD+ diphosphatase